MSLRCPAFSINLGHQQPYVDDDVHIYSSATMRPSRPAHNHGGAATHRPAYVGGVGKPTTLYDPSYAIWSHDRPNDLAIGHDRPTYATRPGYHTTIQDYPQDEYENGYPPVTSGAHVPIDDSSANAVDYSKYRGNRMRIAREDCTRVCGTRRVFSAAHQRSDFRLLIDLTHPEWVSTCSADARFCPENRIHVLP